MYHNLIIIICIWYSFEWEKITPVLVIMLMKCFQYILVELDFILMSYNDFLGIVFALSPFGSPNTHYWCQMKQGEIMIMLFSSYVYCGLYFLTFLHFDSEWSTLKHIFHSYFEYLSWTLNFYNTQVSTTGQPRLKKIKIMYSCNFFKSKKLKLCFSSLGAN